MLWRANSTTTGNYFTARSAVMRKAAARIATQLTEDGLIKPAPVIAKQITVMGGPGYAVQLGCFSCLKFELESVFNKYGHFGSKGQHTLWDPCGEYASANSEYSACNPNAESPPIFVNEYGEEIGRLSVNLMTSADPRDIKLGQWLVEEICVECVKNGD